MASTWRSIRISLSLLQIGKSLLSLCFIRGSNHFSLHTRLVICGNARKQWSASNTNTQTPILSHILFFFLFQILLVLGLTRYPNRSENLVRIAVNHQPHSPIVADILHLPHLDASFDFAISIAVVHHLSSPERRIQAIMEIMRTLKPASENHPGGKALIYVWALEQKNSRRGWDKGDKQDVMVPWVLRNSLSKGGSSDAPKTFHRYYHLYEEFELERDIRQAGGRVLESGYEKDNWWAIATPSNE